MYQDVVLGGRGQRGSIVLLLVTSVATFSCAIDADGGGAPDVGNAPDGGDNAANAAGTELVAPNLRSPEQGGKVATFFVVQMLPAAETSTAVPLTEVELIFNKSVDSGTVDDQSVVLRERESLRTVPISVAVSGVHMTITPLRPLSTNYRYTVDLNDVGSQSGLTLDYAARFFTAPHHPALFLRYTGTEATRSHDFSWDSAAGYLRVDHMLVGADGVLETADDDQDILSQVYFNAEQDNTNSHVRTAPGADGVMKTADDFHLYERTMTYSAAGRTSLQYEWFGADGLVGTADDYFTAADIHEYDASDRLSYNCNGTTCFRYDYSPGERATLVLIGPGADGTWQTADDELDTEWYRALYDQYGVETGSEVHDLAADGTPTPSAATLTGYTDITLVTGLPTEYRTYQGPGADGIWRTGDDLGLLLTLHTYDADGLRQTTAEYEPGLDGLLGNADNRLATAGFY